MNPIVTVTILCLINMLNYMDRMAVASVLKDIQNYYDIDDQLGGLVQTVFFGFFVVFSPLFGFLGDRFPRKWVLLGGTGAWICAVVACSLIPNNLFVLFLFTRGLAGVGQSCCSVLSPSLIADSFTGTKRSIGLMIFYFMIPVGSGIGFLCGSRVGSLLGHWQWGIRFTAMLGMISAVLTFLFLREPRRGALEGVSDTNRETDFWKDCKAVLSIPTYILSTLGLTCVMFLTGSLEWWAPTLIEHAKAWELGLPDAGDLKDSEVNSITMITGAITLASGLIGVVIGSFCAQWLKNGKCCCRMESGDALVCMIGALITVPSMAVGFQMIRYHITIAYILFFIGITAACCNLAVVVDLLLSVVVPFRRNTANSWQTMISSLLGDATGPYIVGLISDSVRHGSTPEAHYHSLVNAFIVPCAVLLLAAVLFLIAIFTTPRDLRKFEEELAMDKLREVELSKDGDGLSWSQKF